VIIVAIFSNVATGRRALPCSATLEGNGEVVWPFSPF
jgi:hypothetical protein